MLRAAARRTRGRSVSLNRANGYGPALDANLVAEILKTVHPDVVLLRRTGTPRRLCRLVQRGGAPGPGASYRRYRQIDDQREC